MVHKSGSAEPVFIAVDHGTVTNIDIFQIGKMAFVKEADFIKHASPVDRSSGTGRKYRVIFGVIRNRSSGSPAYPPAHQGIEISCAVDQIGVVHLDHLAAHRKNPVRDLDRPDHLFDITRIHGCIIV